MKSDSVSVRRVNQHSWRPTVLEKCARRLIFSQLTRLQDGVLEIMEPGETFRFGQRRPEASRVASIRVHDAHFYVDLVFGGTIGAGEAYVQGSWSCEDLVGLVQILLRNRELLDGFDGGLTRLMSPLRHAYHWRHRNSRAGSRRNIAAHYDLGNKFFSLFLDRSMMYSCAIFDRANATLDEAATAKLDRVCQKLELGPNDHVLEIGTGWGGFAIHAAQHYGCRVTTTTLSRQQLEFATERVRAAGLEGRVKLLLKDYRDLDGQYDKLVSIEMIEAVGHEHLDAFFQRCSKLLKPQGRLLLQAITIADQRYAQAKRSVDFIQRYIFPGGALPSVTILMNSITRMSDMRLFHMEDFGLHYAKTLQLWRNRLSANLSRVRHLGYSDAFLRMWDFYFGYCEGGFLERAIGTVQMLLVKPECRCAPLITPLTKRARQHGIGIDTENVWDKPRATAFE